MRFSGPQRESLCQSQTDEEIPWLDVDHNDLFRSMVQWDFGDNLEGLYSQDIRMACLHLGPRGRGSDLSGGYSPCASFPPHDHFLGPLCCYMALTMTSVGHGCIVWMSCLLAGDCGKRGGRAQSIACFFPSFLPAVVPPGTELYGYSSHWMVPHLQLNRSQQAWRYHSSSCSFRPRDL